MIYMIYVFGQALRNGGQNFIHGSFCEKEDIIVSIFAMF